MPPNKYAAWVAAPNSDELHDPAYWDEGETEAEQAACVDELKKQLADDIARLRELLVPNQAAINLAKIDNSVS